MMKLLLLLLPLVAGSETPCATDPDCAYYPNELRRCKDEWEFCPLLTERWCAMFRSTMERKCAHSCVLCDLPSTVCNCSTDWAEWEECSRPCGGGEMSRRRECSRSSGCAFATRQSRHCNTHTCAGWSTCTRSCNGGSQWRHRDCGNTDRSTCPVEYRDCNLNACPSVACPKDDVHRYNSSSSCCVPSPTSSCGRFRISSNIIGGEQVKPSEFPWMLLLSIQTSNFGSVCGAVLISSQWAVTAAHCVSSFKVSELTIRAGLRNIGEAGQRVPIEAVFVHPRFSMPRADIALIKFVSPLVDPLNSGEPIQPICLPRGEVTPVDADCYAAGWGATHPTEHFISPSLNVVKLRNLDLESCLAAHQGTEFGDLIDKSMLCAGTHTGGVDTCAGDSGGPLMCQRCSTCSWYVAGITSFGPTPCGYPGYPGVYTRILEHELWIETTTKFALLESTFQYELDNCYL